MKPSIWLCRGDLTWLETALDETGTLDISTIAKDFRLRPATVQFGDVRGRDCITIANIRDECGSTAGQSKLSPVLVYGETNPGARNEVGRHRLRKSWYWQSFVRSAALNYRQWEQAEKAGDGKEGLKRFLLVSEDPYGNFLDGNLIWVRESYKDLQQIFAKAGAGEKFTLLGTAGIGKSFFTVFWICYLATLKGEVVWKFSSGTCYLLDFSEEVPIAYGPFSDENEKELWDVYEDPSAWLIIDGRQPFALRRRCHVLLACSANKENYKEFSKNPMVSELYLPVWAEEEIIGFLDDFEDARADYPNMDVPSREIALGYFEKLGGVPRYVLCAKQTANRLYKLSLEILYFNLLEKDTCLKHFTGTLHELEMKDGLIHINCWAGEYDTYFFDFASSHVQEEFGNRFNKLSRIAVVEFLEAHAWHDDYGFVFELVAHEVMQRGGKFEMKRVGREGKALIGEAEDDTLTLPADMKVVTFNEVEEIELKPNTYYKPARISNFESIDAVVSPDILVQFFSSRRRQHGYKVNDLKTLHKQLKLSKYKLCSCVPKVILYKGTDFQKDIYKGSGFQNFLKADRTIYDKGEEEVLDRMDQFVVTVDYNEYKRLT